MLTEKEFAKCNALRKKLLALLDKEEVTPVLGEGVLMGVVMASLMVRTGNLDLKEAYKHVAKKLELMAEKQEQLEGELFYFVE